MKKFFSLLLAMIMVFSMSATAFAAEVSESVVKEIGRASCRERVY